MEIPPTPLQKGGYSSMKNDNIIYYLFRECPSIFFELIGEPVETMAHYQLSKVEIERSATRIAGVFYLSKKTIILMISSL